MKRQVGHADSVETDKMRARVPFVVDRTALHGHGDVALTVSGCLL